MLSARRSHNNTPYKTNLLSRHKSSSVLKLLGFWIENYNHHKTVEHINRCAELKNMAKAFKSVCLVSSSSVFHDISTVLFSSKRWEKVLVKIAELAKSSVWVSQLWKNNHLLKTGGGEQYTDRTKNLCADVSVAFTKSRPFATIYETMMKARKLGTIPYHFKRFYIDTKPWLHILSFAFFDVKQRWQFYRIVIVLQAMWCMDYKTLAIRLKI